MPKRAQSLSKIFPIASTCMGVRVGGGMYCRRASQLGVSVIISFRGEKRVYSQIFVLREVDITVLFYFPCFADSNDVKILTPFSINMLR